jgi:hypothetical protein
MNRAWRAGVLILVAATACVRPPPIVVVDRATALEEQAGGSFEELERRLARAGMAPAPEALTPDQLEALGVAPLPLVDDTELTTADRVEALLVQHCIGEGQAGLLVDTRSACPRGSDAREAEVLIERVNRARVQLWRWMHAQRPDRPVAELRSAWREAHLAGVACGAWIERDGRWEAKAC